MRCAVTDRPDVLVMDLRMPDLDGVAATAEIVRVAPEVAVLVLTRFDDDELVFAAMRAGARGYLVKGASQEEIVRAVTAVAAGEASFGPCVARRVLRLLTDRPPASEPAFPELTARAGGARPDRGRPVQSGHRQPARADRQDHRQPHAGDLHEASGCRASRGDHPDPGRRPGPQLTGI